MSKEIFIELIVRTSDGAFESSLKVPVNSTPEQRNGFAKMWVDAMAHAIQLTPSEALAAPREEGRE